MSAPTLKLKMNGSLRPELRTLENALWLGSRSELITVLSRFLEHVLSLLKHIAHCALQWSLTPMISPTDCKLVSGSSCLAQCGQSVEMNWHEVLFPTNSLLGGLICDKAFCKHKYAGCQ